MKNGNHSNRYDMWIDFFRGFFTTCAALLLALGVLFGIHRAQVNTERICFGTQEAADIGAPDEYFSNPARKLMNETLFFLPNGFFCKKVDLFVKL